MSNRITVEHENKRLLGIHYHRMMIIRNRRRHTAVDDGRPAGMRKKGEPSRNRKRIQMQKDRELVIKKENHMLFHKMTQIMQHGGTLKMKDIKHYPIRSLTYDARKAEVDRIDRRNKALLKRLKQTMPYYNVGMWEAEHEYQKRFQALMSQYPDEYKPGGQFSATATGAGSPDKTSGRTGRKSKRPLRASGSESPASGSAPATSPIDLSQTADTSSRPHSRKSAATRPSTAPEAGARGIVGGGGKEDDDDVASGARTPSPSPAGKKRRSTRRRRKKRSKPADPNILSPLRKPKPLDLVPGFDSRSQDMLVKSVERLLRRVDPPKGTTRQLQKQEQTRKEREEGSETQELGETGAEKPIAWRLQPIEAGRWPRGKMRPGKAAAVDSAYGASASAALLKPLSPPFVGDTPGAVDWQSPAALSPQPSQRQLLENGESFHWPTQSQPAQSPPRGLANSPLNPRAKTREGERPISSRSRAMRYKRQQQMELEERERQAAREDELRQSNEAALKIQGACRTRVARKKMDNIRQARERGEEVETRTEEEKAAVARQVEKNRLENLHSSAEREYERQQSMRSMTTQSKLGAKEDDMAAKLAAVRGDLHQLQEADKEVAPEDTAVGDGDATGTKLSGDLHKLQEADKEVAREDTAGGDGDATKVGAVRGGKDEATTKTDDEMAARLAAVKGDLAHLRGAGTSATTSTDALDSEGKAESNKDGKSGEEVPATDKESKASDPVPSVASSAERGTESLVNGTKPPVSSTESKAEQDATSTPATSSSKADNKSGTDPIVEGTDAPHTENEDARPATVASPKEPAEIESKPPTKSKAESGKATPEKAIGSKASPTPSTEAESKSGAQEATPGKTTVPTEVNSGAGDKSESSTPAVALAEANTAAGTPPLTETAKGGSEKGVLASSEDMAAKIAAVRGELQYQHEQSAS